MNAKSSDGQECFASADRPVGQNAVAMLTTTDKTNVPSTLLINALNSGLNQCAMSFAHI